MWALSGLCLLSLQVCTKAEIPRSCYRAAGGRAEHSWALGVLSDELQAEMWRGAKDKIYMQQIQQSHRKAEVKEGKSDGKGTEGDSEAKTEPCRKSEKTGEQKQQPKILFAENPEESLMPSSHFMGVQAESISHLPKIIQQVNVRPRSG